MEIIEFNYKKPLPQISLTTSDIIPNRKLKDVWTYEAAQDLRSQHGIYSNYKEYGYISMPQPYVYMPQPDGSSKMVKVKK